ncbi:hypothetical protein KAR34_00970 [bacterium]|nr:hypothetical protein [bacterium]
MDIMFWFEQYPIDALPYEIGFVLLAISMIWYSIVLKKMLAIINGKPVWILPLIGAGCILVSVAMHSIAYVVLLPKMDLLESVDQITKYTAFILQWRAWSLAGIMAGGVFSLIGGGLYYKWTTR